MELINSIFFHNTLYTYISMFVLAFSQKTKFANSAKQKVKELIKRAFSFATTDHLFPRDKTKLFLFHYHSESVDGY